MKKLLLYGALAFTVLAGASTAEAKSSHHRDRDRHDHHDRDRHHYSDHGNSRTIYVIENRRPVRRVVYLNPGGGYYRLVGGRRVIVRERYYTSYPSRYYYPDGRRRVGISFSF